LSAFLLHLRSSVSIRHVENDIDAFEQAIIPDTHYALSREGRTANYVVVPDRGIDEFHGYLTAHARRYSIERISLIEIGRSWRVAEQGCVVAETYDAEDQVQDVFRDESLAAEDYCGEWRYALNDETRCPGQIRVRTGLDRWLWNHGRGSKEPNQRTCCLLLYFHHPLEENSRWLAALRSRLGKTSRPHLRDDKSVLLTWNGAAPRQLFEHERFRPYIFDPSVHTAFAFTMGVREKHTNGALESVRAPLQPDRGQGDRQDIGARAPPRLVVSRTSQVDAQLLKSALEKLRAERRQR
jgi:hypothetical protein